ncbi:ParB/RepB/Spo0J family partition protein [Streptomyces sp. NPDC005423]|uniref:ParB/RepB/Spo0J family partition protein n=1 Tax=Streptomyces sp. NPDC005423 TaxID=3155343 RepID=UPI0033A274F8
MATTITADQTAESVPVDTDEENLTAVLLDPEAIVRDEFNAREHDTEPDADLINSVKAVGVQDPVSVRPRPNGTYGAFKGWRRTQAAQIANATAEAEGHAKRQLKAYVRADLVGRDAWTH